jgi:hypothetical protein
MKLEDIRVVGAPLVLATEGEVARMEAQLATTFPAGYREYVTRLGQGVLGGSYIRIYPPWMILDGEMNVAEWRRRIDEYWFWDDGSDVLSKARALECIIVGDTLNGDELIFHPAAPDVLYVLPRDQENVYRIGQGLFAAIDWLCTSGQLTEPFEERDFEPFDSRKER